MQPSYLRQEKNVMADEKTFTPAIVLESPKGHFPSLDNRLHSELKKYHDRANSAVVNILNATRQKTEILEAMADKARMDLEAETREIQKALGKLD